MVYTRKVSEVEYKRFWNLVKCNTPIDSIVKMLDVNMPSITPRMARMWYGCYLKGYRSEDGKNTDKIKQLAKQGIKDKSKNRDTTTIINPTKSETKVQVQSTTLIGMDAVIKRVEFLANYGTKGIFIAGYHGLGKSTIVMELAKKHDAKTVRFQITETLTEFDIVGVPNMKTGEFMYSPLVEALRESNQNPDKKYYIILDEFTRGTPESKQILFPLLAEKILYINSAYSPIKSITAGNNVKIFATGNLHDSGQCELSQAEMDRYNIVEIEPIITKSILLQIIQSKVNINIAYPPCEKFVNELIYFYQDSWNIYMHEKTILAMSVRTLIETARLGSELIAIGQ